MAQNLKIAEFFLKSLTPHKATAPWRFPELEIERDGKLQILYAPFDHIETRARLVVVGITPGKVQAVNALQAAQKALQSGKSIPDALAAAKLTASFSGALTRNNLVSMLNAIGVAKHFNITTTAELFRPGATDVHFTSALRYPVLVNGENYSGSPNMLKTPILRSMLETHLAEEARALPDAIWLPLGDKAEAAVMHLSKLGLLAPERILTGMPHPSGANGERVQVFLGRKRPADASSKTKPGPLLEAHRRLSAQIAALG